ncbi:uncharacterized protein LOC104583087 [Brachypodium distachyon]|uniref:uncharacterized protein LOC104583087 n=1 Tax=Brachypodium distachyon TaxID=15368 RepID=UPI000D0CF8AA|nr:uncharacterized protein LOC104583087 [Brachypodium distachyon]|eukprot:XP_024314512.1 uncharacterized protein LOC104583087 [Brachypodium distachyon]
MGDSSHSKPPPPKILVPYPFDFPPAAARTRMLVPAYDLMFGKLSMCNLFDGHFLQPGWNAGITFKPSVKDDHISKNGGDALLRWQRDLDDPHTFVDLLVSTSKPLRLRSCAYYPKYGISAFGVFPLLMENRACSEDYGVMGLRYISENLSIGGSFVPFPSSHEIPYGAWLVGRKGNLSAGLQYKPLNGSNHPMPFINLKNWNCAISYCNRPTCPLSPSLNFALELVRSKQLVASVYQHHILQGREKYRLGRDHITGSVVYVDFGLEMATRVDKDKPADNADKSSIHIAASLQLNNHLLVKGKLGPSNSSVALAFKLPPFFTLSVTVTKQSMETGRFDYDSNDFVNLPTYLKPIDKVL